MIYEAFVLFPLSLIAPELGRGKVRGLMLMYSTNKKSSRPLDRIPIVLSNLEPGAQPRIRTDGLVSHEGEYPAY
jgi:hypothetical protein